MANCCGIIIELIDGNKAVIWNDQTPVRKKYKAYIINSKNEETGEKKLISSDTKLKILGFTK